MGWNSSWTEVHNLKHGKIYPGGTGSQTSAMLLVDGTGHQAVSNVKLTMNLEWIKLDRK